MEKQIVQDGKGRENYTYVHERDSLNYSRKRQCGCEHAQATFSPILQRR